MVAIDTNTNAKVSCFSKFNLIAADTGGAVLCKPGWTLGAVRGDPRATSYRKLHRSIEGEILEHVL